MLIARQKVPELKLSLLGGGEFDLLKDGSERGTVICFFRGLHCKICTNYLTELEGLIDKFAERGVQCIAVSSDSEDRTQQMADKIGADKLRLAYGLDLEKAKEWGLYISTSRGKTTIGVEEPALFSEPGLFLVQPDGSLYYGSVQTMPFVRPQFKDLIAALDFAIEHNYPARGEYTGDVSQAA